MKTYIAIAERLLHPQTKWVVMYIVLGAFFLIVTNVGYITYAWHETDTYQYTGANAYAAADKLVYLSMIEQGRQGALFMKNLHTTDPQKGTLFSPHWYIIGQTARLFSISNLASYQLYRILFTVGFLVALFFIISRLAEQYLDRLGTTLFVFFSGGLGWLYIAFHPEGLYFGAVAKKFLLLPTDMYVTEGNTLLNFAQAPLFALSQLMIVLLFYLFVAYRDHSRVLQRVLFFVLSCTLSLIHPYDIPLVLVVLGSWVVWHIATTRSFRTVGSYLAVIAGCGLGIAYHFYTVISDPVIKGWLSQNLVYSPALHLYVWGYGLLVPFALVGLWQVFQRHRNNPWWVLISLWVLLMPVLLYMPTTLNRRFINAFHIALALIAYQGFQYCIITLRHLSARITVGLFVAIGLLGSMIFFLVVNLHFDDSIYTRGLYYTTVGDRAAIEFLRERSSAEANLLVLGRHANFVSVSALPRAIFRGHDHQVPRFELKDQQLAWFAADQGLARARERKLEFLHENNIDYVVINDARVDPRIAWTDEAAYLEKVYEEKEYRIYRVAS